MDATIIPCKHHHENDSPMFRHIIHKKYSEIESSILFFKEIQIAAQNVTTNLHALKESFDILNLKIAQLDDHLFKHFEKSEQDINSKNRTVSAHLNTQEFKLATDGQNTPNRTLPRTTTGCEL